MDEINSVNDNPVISHEEEYVFHGGNFHGDYISLEMDKLKIAITRLTMLMERQLNFLLSDNLNQKLPPLSILANRDSISVYREHNLQQPPQQQRIKPCHSRCMSIVFLVIRITRIL